MPLAPVRFGPKATVTTYTDTVAGRYTPSASTAVVKQIIICNTSSSSGTINVGIGTSDLAANRIICLATVSGNETITYNTNIPMTSSEKLYFVSGGTAGTAITVTINSYEE